MIQWVLGTILAGVVIAVFWDVYARGKRGAARVWWAAAGIAAAVAGILQGAEVDPPWPLLALGLFVLLLVAANLADRRAKVTRDR